MKLKNKLIWSLITMNNTILWSSYKVHLSFFFPQHTYHCLALYPEPYVNVTFKHGSLSLSSASHIQSHLLLQTFWHEYLSFLYTSLWSRCVVVWGVLLQFLHSMTECNTTPCWELVLWLWKLFLNSFASYIVLAVVLIKYKLELPYLLLRVCGETIHTL